MQGPICGRWQHRGVSTDHTALSDHREEAFRQSTAQRASRPVAGLLNGSSGASRYMSAHLTRCRVSEAAHLLLQLLLLCCSRSLSLCCLAPGLLKGLQGGLLLGLFGCHGPEQETGST